MMMMMIDDEKDDNDDNGEIYDDNGPLAGPGQLHIRRE